MALQSKGLEDRRAQLEEWYEEQVMVVDEDEDTEARRELDDFVADEAANLHEVLPGVFRASLFLAAYGSFEHFLVNLCRHYEAKLGGISIGDLKHKGIRGAQVYLKKVVGMTFPDDLPEWSELNRYRELRNAIAHNSGLIEATQAIVEFQNLVRTFVVEKDHSVRLGESFNNTFLDTVGRFADAVTDAAPALP